ncbi:MAG: response regulator [Desulfobacterales bacterium]|jgi:two-component system alkaline phosphatase synthesis response regulator PhoP
MTTVSKKILVVDDEEAIRQVIKMGLVKLGYDPECAKNGKEGLEILEREEFPLILMDLRLPEIDGIELCMRIKERNPETVIYAFSGLVAEVEYYQLEEMGLDGLLCKPVTFEVLERAIKGAFEKINKRREKLHTSLCSSLYKSAYLHMPDANEHCPEVKEVDG